MSRSAAAATASKRPKRVRSACVAVVGGVVIFAILQLGLALGIETSLSRVRDPLYGSRLVQVRKRLRTGRTQTVVMLGSSRTRFGFRVGENEQAWAVALGRPVAAFNFGADGGGPLTELLTWRRLDRDGVRPDLLLVEVTPPLLAEQVPPNDYREDYLPTDRLAWQDLPLVERYARDRRAGLASHWLNNWPFPWYAHRFSLVSLVVPNLLPSTFRLDEAWKVDSTGAMGFIEEPATPLERSQGMPRVGQAFQAYFSGFRLGGQECDALQELLASCRKEGVPAALVMMPEGPAFRSLYPPGVLDQVKEWVDQLSREYGAPIVNAREWFDEVEFRDSNHLLKTGADKFTERLGRECIVPLLRRTPGQQPYAGRLP